VNDGQALRAEILALIQRYFDRKEIEDAAGRAGRIPLGVPSYGSAEVCEAVDSLLDRETTMGHKVRRFESLFAQYIGVKHAIMVNSGSSANLVALSVLTNPLAESPLTPGDEVITPAVTWATTVFPIVQRGLVPVLVDVDLRSMNVLPEQVARAVTSRTRAIMPVHLLGNPCDMDPLMEIAREHGLLVIEDACESHGAEYRGHKTGSIGDLGTFSFFFTHHITTMEGGMVVTNNDRYAELARTIRVFGWARDLPDLASLGERYRPIDPRWLFVNIGFNMRPTELQGAFGMHQLPCLERFIEIRRDNARFWDRQFADLSDVLWTAQEAPGTRHVYFAYPLIVRTGAAFTRDELTELLEGNGIETRPIMAGNIDEQPAMRLVPYRRFEGLANARYILRNAFLVGNHHGIGERERERLVDVVRSFLATRVH
jgi:CDP-4-dehydro-6-deoxyglucose reductase, E1